MTSSMMAGERRWASARRGGMTVLGKVAVPKPLNLPSQRLENHGMDPTVEIVPKGTLSWGSRPSSSTSNAWGSSTLSPKADGGTSSPSHLSGRPSSGSGTRPSSSCSDITHEPNSNAWGQSSRPSSASGALRSNQTALASLRPRSAETRPGSSHLSRFAETSSDNSVAWGPTVISEKLGVASTKNDGFSLSSGDFPTLGAEKENSGKSTDQDHGTCSRPGSSSRVASGKELTATSSIGDDSLNASVTVNTWRRDGPQYVEEGMFQPPVEKWSGDRPPYLNANLPPQHFDAWRGPPLNPPGVWYRGPPGGRPYATPLGPGGFPMEPFPYYGPQIPPPALANSQPVPPPGAGPRGHHPKNGDMYRPHMPDGYVRPGMPIRPGFYPGPVPYEGFYGPPMGYCNSSERDFPFMGMPAGPPIYNRYPGENAPPDPGNNHPRPGLHGPTGRASVLEQVESGHPEDVRGPYKVLLKQHNEWDEKQAEDKWEHTLPDSAPYPGKGDPPRKSSQKNEWGSEDRKDDEIYSGRRILGGDEISSKNFDNRGRYSSDLPENSRGKAKTVDHYVYKSENAASTFSHAPQVFPATPNASTLIQKIEGLNAKARASDGRPDAASAPSGEEQWSRSQVGDAKVNYVRNEAGTGFGRINTSENLVPASRELDIPTADNSLHSTASSGKTVSSRASHGVQGRFDRHGKRFNPQDADGWRKKPLAAESTSGVSALTSEPSSNVPAQDPLPSVIAAEKYVINLQEKEEGQSLTPIVDPSYCQEQRAKTREIAKQRALQLQKEEEERIREQKAKALAKLEELNRRTQATDGSTQKMEDAPPSVSIPQDTEECQVPAEPVMVASKSETPTPELDSNPNAQITKKSAIGATESTDLSNATPIEMSENAQLKRVVPDMASAADPKAAVPVNEGGISRNKRVGYKQRHNISLGGNLMEKSVPISSIEAQKNNPDVAINDVASTEVFAVEVGPPRESNMSTNPNILAESSAHQRRKNSRSSKNKHKSDDVPSVTALVPKEPNAEKASLESGKLGSSELELELDPSSIQPSDGQQTSLPTEEPSGRANSQWKSQHARRMPKSQQGNRNAEKDAVIWAPVRSDKKAEFIDEASSRALPDTVIATAKGDNVIHSNPKSKRAEMERYVPKPVAKEQLAQQTLLDETVESSHTVNLTIGNIVCTVESGNGNGKQNKQSKVHGSWRQRGSQDGSSSSISDPSNIQESIEQQQEALKPEVNSMKEKTQLSDNWNDGWNTCENSDAAAPVLSAVVKEQGVTTGRGKRHPFKGHRNVSSGDTDRSSSQSPAPEIVGQTDKSSASKESRTTSHWQPKSQVYAFANQRGNRPGGGQSATAAEVRNPIKKDSHSLGRVQMAPDHVKEGGEHTVQPSNDQSASEQNEVVVPNVGHQESKRERKDSFRGQPIPPNQGSVVDRSDLVPPPSGDAQNEQQRFSSGFRKNGSQNNRSGRVHESRGDWSLGGQDNRQHNNTSSNRERQRHNSHYEYQPIGQQTYAKSNNFEGPTDGSHNPGSRYRERSQGHSRRGGGNFNNRQSGTVHIDGSYD